MALELVAIAPWLLVGMLGIGLAVTGRPLILGLPVGVPQGWPVRLFGLLYAVVGSYFTYRVIQGGWPTPAALALTYAVLAVLVTVGLSRRFRARS